MNQLFLSGRVIKEPDIRISPTPQKSVAHLHLAVKRRYSGDSDYFTLTGFGNKAKYIKDNICKGDNISARITVQNNNYEKDGVMQYMFDFIIDDIELVKSV